MPRASRGLVGLVGLGLVVVIVAAGASLSPQGRADDGSELAFTRVHLDALHAATDEIRRLRAELAAQTARAQALDQRLDAAEQRLGMVPPKPSTLKAFGGADARLAVVDTLRIDRLGAKGRRAKLTAEVPRGGPWVLTYWATWCKPCTSAEELAALARLRAQLGRHDIPLVSVTVDPPGKAEADPRAPTWLYPYHQAKDAHLATLPRAFVEQAGVNLPLHLVIDGAGRVVWYRPAALDEAAIRDLVTVALAAKGQ